MKDMFQFNESKVLFIALWINKLITLPIIFQLNSNKYLTFLLLGWISFVFSLFSKSYFCVESHDLYKH